jgi:hypothetical protein
MINMVKLIWAFDLEAGEKNVDDNIATGFIDGFTTALPRPRRSFRFGLSRDLRSMRRWLGKSIKLRM